MAITNVSKPGAASFTLNQGGKFMGFIMQYPEDVTYTEGTMTNVSKVSIGETWGSITSTWASETDNWQQASSLITNQYNIPANTYTVSATTYAPRTITGSATSLTLADDETVEVSLPFLFNFFGEQYPTVYIGSNGFLSFSFYGQSFYYAGNIPSTDPLKPNAAIYGYYFDLDPSQGGTIKYETFGSSGSRVFVVEYANIQAYQLPTTNFTFQIMLFEADNSIEVHTTSTTNVAAGGVQGIENLEGTIAYYLTGRNGQIMQLTNDAVRFQRASLITNLSKP